MNDNNCPYMKTICDYDGEEDEVCGLWWKQTRQDNKPYYNRDRLYCFDQTNCKRRKVAEETKGEHE